MLGIQNYFSLLVLQCFDHYLYVGILASYLYSTQFDSENFIGRYINVQ